MILEKQYNATDFARMAWRRVWLIVVPFVLGLFGTLLVSSTLLDQYQSEMLIQVVPQRVPDSYVRSTVTLRTEDRINALSQQAMSRTELEQLIEAFDLYEEEHDRLPMQDVVEHMRSNVQLEIALGGDRGSADAEAFYVRFTYPDAGVATRVTGRIGALFVEQNARDRGALAEGTNEFLEAQLVEARIRLEELERRLEVFRQRHAGRLPDQLQFNMQAMQNAQLQLQAHAQSLARDRDRRLMLERLFGDILGERVAPDASLDEVTHGQEVVSTDVELVSTTTGSAEVRLARAEVALAALELRLKPEHPDLARMKRVIDTLEREVAEAPEETQVTVLTPEELERRERLQQMRAEIESLARQIDFKVAEEQRLREAIRDYEQRIEAIPSVESEWVSLSRDYETQQEAYKDLLAKSELAKLAADLERRQVGEQFRVIDPPRVPANPSSPDRTRLSALGTVASLFLGLGLAAFVEVRDSSFRATSEVVEVLALPVIASVPYVESDADRRRQLGVRVLLSGTATIMLAGCGYVFWTMELWRFIV